MNETLEKLNQEKNELNRLINNGIQFEIVADVVETKRRFLFFRHKFVTKKNMKFSISEPTLGTLDRIASESIGFAITEEQMKDVDNINKGMEIATNTAKKCARVVAYAVIGNEYEIATVGKDGRISYKKDFKRLEELTNLFLRTIKPSSLFQIVTMIDLMCNLGDFINSIRLLTSDRTTMPNRIEKGD